MKAEIFSLWFTWYINYFDENGEYIRGSSEHAPTKQEAVNRALFWNCKEIVFV